VNKRFRVRLDMRLLTEHLSREDGAPKTEAEVLQWLAEARFVREDETHWIVAEADLGQVEPAEVLEAEPLD